MSGVNLWFCLLLVALPRISFCAPSPLVHPTSSDFPSSSVVVLAWSPSPDTSVTGYFVCWGLSSTICTNALDVGNVTNATVEGLSPGTVYFFTVVAYDAAGNQAPPSNMIAYTPRGALSIQPFSADTGGPCVSLNFHGTAGVVYALQATQDFKTWSTIFTTNCASAGPIAFQVSDLTAYPRRFFRLLQQ